MAVSSRFHAAVQFIFKSLMWSWMKTMAVRCLSGVHTYELPGSWQPVAIDMDGRVWKHIGHDKNRIVQSELLPVSDSFCHQTVAAQICNGIVPCCHWTTTA